MNFYWPGPKWGIEIGILWPQIGSEFGGSGGTCFIDWVVRASLILYGVPWRGGFQHRECMVEKALKMVMGF